MLLLGQDIRSQVDLVLKQLEVGIPSNSIQLLSSRLPLTRGEYLALARNVILNSNDLWAASTDSLAQLISEKRTAALEAAILEKQKIRPSLVNKHIWQERFQDIRNFERYLSRNGIAVVKFFLNVSKEEQKRRFLERANTPEKNWQLSASDMADREFWMSTRRPSKT